VFENRDLRRIFRPKRGEILQVKGGWRKLHNELSSFILFAKYN
jgi:hypothetical protein